MKKLLVLVAVGALILAAVGCDTLNVGQPGNHAPVISAATFDAATDTLTVQVTDTDTNDPVTVSVSAITGLTVDATSKVISTSGSVAFHYTATDPAAGGTGTTTITATDGVAQDTDTATITVDPVTGVAPVIGTPTWDGAGNLVVPVTDADSTTVTVSVTNITGWTVDATSEVVTVPGNATFVWTGTGTGTTTISATDGALTATPVDFPMTWGAVNTAPVITSATFAGAVLTVAVTDAENNDVTVTVTAPAGSSVDNTSQTVTGGNGNATFTFTATDAHAGVNGTVDIVAADASLQDTDSATLTIAPVNQPPAFGTVTFAGGVLTVPVTDADNDDVSITVTNVAGWTVDANTKTVTGGNGSVTFTWTGSGAGDTTITADDAHGGVINTTQALAAPNNLPTVSATATGGVLTVTVADADGDDVTVTVDVPAGLVNATLSQVVTGGNGNAVFTYTAADFIGGGSGTVNISADDGKGGAPATATQAITIPAKTVAADTLYAFPEVDAAAVGTPVTIWVVTGTPANSLEFLTTVGFTCESDGNYVADSFNYGIPGGTRKATDGYWALMGPPAPASYLDLGDDTVPGLTGGVDIGGGLWRYNFAIVPQGVFTAPATLPGGVGYLYTFQLTFSTAGTKHLSFQLNDGSFDQTYYSDGANNNYFWATLASQTLTIN